MIETLPDYRPIVYEEIDPPWFVHKRYMSVHPPIQKAPNGDIMYGCSAEIEYEVRPDGLCMPVWIPDPLEPPESRYMTYKVKHFHCNMWKPADHPNLKALPPHTPRIVKAIYKQSFQLRILRATECDPDIAAAFDAWWLFVANSQKMTNR